MARYKSKIKEIDQKLDFIIAKIDLLEDILVSKFNINVCEELEKIENKKKSVDDHYFDPTKYPNIEGDITISETNKHFE